VRLALLLLWGTIPAAVKNLLLQTAFMDSLNGKPQALPLDFAYACGSPLNENDQYTMSSSLGERRLNFLLFYDKSWMLTRSDL
jgi:hypothetical protein